jgi:hypothetical protein
MALKFSPTLAKQLLPFPGDATKVAMKSTAALEKLVGAKLPAKLDEAEELERGVALRIHHRYNEKGGWDRSTVGAALVDLWVQRGGVELATRLLARVCSATVPQGGYAKPYVLRHDGQPWARLRLHLCAQEDISSARVIAAGFREKAKGELGTALAFAFCVPEWVEEEIEPMIEDGYGRWAVLTAIQDRAKAVAVAKRMTSLPQAFQLYEEAVPHMPTLVRTMGDAGKPIIEKMVDKAYNAKAKKPFLALLGCYS